jgi:glyceraldehyde-3-phosphate dehydrogenase (NADP+)
METSCFLINGEWRLTERRQTIVNPFTGEPVAEVCQAGQPEIHEAIEGAVAAFRLTRRLHSFQRSDALASIALGIRARRQEFARLITSDTGKPISLSRAEVDRAVFTFATAAEEAKRVGGEILPLDLSPSSEGRFAIVRRFPIGPVSAITPFNFPLNLVAHKLGPAIAAGNSVVMKPSSSGARVALMLGQIILDSNLPKGAVSIVTCAGDEARQLVIDERIKLLTFTGSPAVGWDMKAKAGKKKVVLELGGNAGVMVDKDVDIESIVERLVQGAFANAGQSCISVQRVFVHEKVFGRFVEKFVEMTQSICTGDPNEEETLVGPMINEEAAMMSEQRVLRAVGAGATVLCGGKRKGAFLEPTILSNVNPSMEVCGEEVFAPIVTVGPFESMQEAVGLVNQSSFGLQAGIFTNNLTDALDAYRDLDVGGVILNDFPTYRIDHMPYGGIKGSGFGREGVKYAIEEMTEPKLLAVKSP